MDCRYPERMGAVKFHGFPNAKKELDKCLRWMKACGRPHDQLNITRLNHNKAVCSTVRTNKTEGMHRLQFSKQLFLFRCCIQILDFKMHSICQFNWLLIVPFKCVFFYQTNSMFIEKVTVLLL